MRFSFSNLILKSEIVGIGINQLSNSEFIFTGVILCKEKDEISVVKVLESTSEIDQLKNFITKNSVIYLSIEGFGILNRVTNLSTNDSKYEDAAHAFHGMNLEEFYIQNFDWNNNRFSSAIKKSRLTEILCIIPRPSFVVDIFLGPISTVPFLNFIHENISRLETTSFCLDFTNTYAQLNSSLSYSIDYAFIDDKINANNILPYFAGLHHFVKSNYKLKEVPEFIKIDYSEYRYHKWYKQIVYGLLASYFLILALNTLIFTQNSRKLEKLGTRLSEMSQSIEQMNELQDKIIKYEKFISLSGIKDFSSKSLYIDRICSLMPNEIRLLEINFSPLAVESKSQNINNLFASNILISGEVQSIETLNNWIQLLEKERWIKETQLRIFQINPRTKTGEFVLDIQLK